MVDRLSNDYAAAGSPVVFIEQNSMTPLGNRAGRFWAANGTDKVTHTPLNMVDSGHQISSGYVSFYSVYKGMVDNELARSAQAEVNASYWRIGNHIEADVVVQNLSGTALSSTANGAYVGILVYEDAKVQLTSRFMRAVGGKAITSTLWNGASTTFHLTTDDLASVVNWNKLHAVAYVDYRPGGTTGAYDMLQAAVAAFAPSFSVQPSSLSFTVNQEPPNDPEATLQMLGGPAGTRWSVDSKPGWVTVTPNSGVVNTTATVRVDGSALQEGKNTGTLRFRAAAGATVMYETVAVSATYTPPKPELHIQPVSLNFTVDQEPPNNPQSILTMNGSPTGISWKVESAPTWVTVTPATGAVNTAAVVQVNGSALALGNNTGTIKFSASFKGDIVYQEIPVSATYSPPAPQITIKQNNLVYFIDPNSPADRGVTIDITGSPADLVWTMDSKPDWVTFTPVTGVVSSGVPAKLVVVVSLLQPGENIGAINFSASKYGMTAHQTINIKAIYAPYVLYYCPFVSR